MRKKIQKAFIPHGDNNYDPHILRHTGIFILSLTAFISFALSAFHAAVLLSHSNFLAAIFPKVLVDLTNESRLENNEFPLTTNGLLAKSAEAKAKHMAENGYFAHTSPDGITPWHWFIESGYTFSRAGENLAVNFVDSKDVVDAWLESPGHRANILNSDFTEIGIATAEGVFQGKSAVFVVQHFGTPISLPPPPASTPVAEASEPETLPEVAGEEINETGTEETEPVPLPEAPELEFSDLAVTSETDTFIEIENTGIGTEAESSGEEAGVSAKGLETHESTLFERFASQPRQVLLWAYALLAFVIIIALTIAILVEVEKQHPRHVGYTLLLLALLVALMYLNRAVIFPDLLIV